MYIHIHMYNIYVYTHINMSTQVELATIYTCIHIYMCMYTEVYICVCIHIHVCIHTHLNITSIRIYTGGACHYAANRAFARAGPPHRKLRAVPAQL